MEEYRIAGDGWELDPNCVGGVAGLMKRIRRRRIIAGVERQHAQRHGTPGTKPRKIRRIRNRHAAQGRRVQFESVRFHHEKGATTCVCCSSATDAQHDSLSTNHDTSNRKQDARRRDSDTTGFC